MNVQMKNAKIDWSAQFMDEFDIGLSPKEIDRIQKEDPDVKCIVSWMEAYHAPSQSELAMSSPTVRYYWSCSSQLKLHGGVL